MSKVTESLIIQLKLNSEVVTDGVGVDVDCGEKLYPEKETNLFTQNCVGVGVCVWVIVGVCVGLGVAFGVRSNSYSDVNSKVAQISLLGVGVGQIVLLYVISKSGQIPL